MPNIVLTRIDNRLVHGQVATQWCGPIGANLILVANDEVAGNKLRQGLMDMAAPSYAAMRYWTIEKTISTIHKASDKQHIFIVCETPQDVLKLVEGGVPIKKVNIGNVYDAPIDAERNNMTSTIFSIQAKNSISQLHCFDCPVYIEMQSGMSCILIGTQPDKASLKTFAVHRYVKINPGLFFSLVSMTASCSYKLIVDSGYHYSIEELSPAYSIDRVIPYLRINEILGYYYNIRNSGYNFKGETHNYFELTYVDRGCMKTIVDGKGYELSENNLLIYGPGQFHCQEIPEGESCSYVTIIFDLDNTNHEDNKVIYRTLLNRVFGYDKKIHTLIKAFVNESNSQLPFMNSLIICLLQETVIRLLQSDFIEQTDQHPVTEVRQNYQDEMLNQILSYISETITEPITVAEICQKFSLSRSSLQILFKENLEQTPKKYISELKLDKSCQLIRENKYTISEIALMLGFNSIQYFSKAFTQKYNIAPSEYAKQIFNN
jgi:mannose/fructose/N-acetylgalactosamine-specific phosphotransferase system component IIB/AraC-like DNA-binding protein